MTDTYEITLSRRCENVLMCSLCLPSLFFCYFSSAPSLSLTDENTTILTPPRSATIGLLGLLTHLLKSVTSPVIAAALCQSTDLSNTRCLSHLRTNLEVNLLKMPEAAGRRCWLLSWEREGEAGAPW